MSTLNSGLDSESQFVTGESREEFAQLQADYTESFAPATPEERFQVDNLIRNEWLLRRYHRVESQLLQAAGVQPGEAFAKSSTVFMRLQRLVTAAEKAYRQAKHELSRLQAQDTKAKTQELASFRTIPPAPAKVDPTLDPTSKMCDYAFR